ncbi:MAG TPA: tautomerase family protein [Casimicrobiaceae bacterium]|nr:tautomerase family protein [Casimicrobiaceae bacterium]
MPLVTLTLRQPAAPGVARRMLDEVHAALVAGGVPPTDRFQRVLELAPGAIVVDPRYPDLERDRSERYALVEVLWSVGRSVKIKRKVAADIAAGVARAGSLDPDDVMVVFVETAWENWAFAGGRLLHAS